MCLFLLAQGGMVTDRWNCSPPRWYRNRACWTCSPSPHCLTLVHMHCLVLPAEPLTCVCTPRSSPHSPLPQLPSLTVSQRVCWWCCRQWVFIMCVVLEEKTRVGKSYHVLMTDSALGLAPTISKTMEAWWRILSSQDLVTFIECVIWGGGSSWHKKVSASIHLFSKCFSVNCVLASVASTLDSQSTKETKIPVF